MTNREVSAALAGSAAASAAVAAPTDAALAWSDAPPWRWVVRPESIDLWADRTREPSDRIVLIRGGEALYHVRLALAVDGLEADIDLLPSTDPDHLATVTAHTRIPVTTEAQALYAATDGPASIADTTPEQLRPELVRSAAKVGVTLDLAIDGRGVLRGDGAGPDAWLRAGEALAAVWVTAGRHGLVVNIEPQTVAGSVSSEPRLVLLVSSDE